ncbi:hypothetical protein D3C74_360520 [compost metagenome]
MNQGIHLGRKHGVKFIRIFMYYETIPQHPCTMDQAVNAPILGLYAANQPLDLFFLRDIRNTVGDLRSTALQIMHPLPPAVVRLTSAYEKNSCLRSMADNILGK